jgi:hypothetical protein
MDQCEMHKKWCIRQEDCGIENVCSVCTDELFSKVKGQIFNGQAITSYKNLKFYDAKYNILCKPSDLMKAKSSNKTKKVKLIRRKRSDPPNSEPPLHHPFFYKKTKKPKITKKKTLAKYQLSTKNNRLTSKQKALKKNKQVSLFMYYDYS